MPSLVLLTDDAAHDLEEIHDYIAQHDSNSRANHVLERIFTPCRQSPPRKLQRVAGPWNPRIPSKPYRLIYREIEDDVYVLVRWARDMRALLERRLLRADLIRVKSATQNPPTLPSLTIHSRITNF